MVAQLLDAEAFEPAERIGRVQAEGVTICRGARRVIDDVALTVEPGQLVAIVGPSGAGKSTLLEALARVRPTTEGTVHVECPSGHADVGFVPQDDIIHKDLPLRATLRHAARLRLPAGTDYDALVDAVIDDLGLRDQASLRVGSLSGGQRKRACIAVELLAQPCVLMLDEPTAGLDPMTAASLVRQLRALADAGRTVIMTTHNGPDLAAADAVAVLASDGRLAHFGDAARALELLGVSAALHRPMRSAVPVARPALPAAPQFATGRPGVAQQFSALTRRNLQLMTANRLTVTVLLGAPALVIAMFVALFRPGVFSAARTPSMEPITTTHWLAFAAFFFGVTYGLLQICTEVAVARRERYAGVRVGPYLLAKLAVLVPFLLVVDVAMVMTLRMLDRLPPLDTRASIALVAATLADAVVALLMGLLISALVREPSHATIALPLVCFPAVLFAGAIVPVTNMAPGGRMMAVVTPARWSFDAIGSVLHLHKYVPEAAHFSGTAVAGSVGLGLFGIGLLAATMATLRRRLA